MAKEIKTIKTLDEQDRELFAENLLIADDSGALATAIILILNSEFERNKLIEYGKQRIEDFSYQIISKQLLSLYLRLN